MRAEAVRVLQSLRGATVAPPRRLSNGVIMAIAGLVMAALAAGRDTINDNMTAVLAGVLERRFERVELSEPVSITGIVVLGGGEDRLREAGRLARRYVQAKLHVSGAGDAEFVWRILGDGIEPARVSIEAISRNTFENAVNSRRLVDPLPGERWLLVTSAMHMPRSMGAFRKSGFWPEPWPVDDRAAGLEAVVREWTALLWYWMSGRGTSLLPGPL